VKTWPTQHAAGDGFRMIPAFDRFARTAPTVRPIRLAITSSGAVPIFASSAGVQSPHAHRSGFRPAAFAAAALASHTPSDCVTRRVTAAPSLGNPTAGDGGPAGPGV